MSEFPVCDENDAPSISKTMLKLLKAKYGFIPNFVGELALSPVALKAYISLTSIYGQSELTPMEQKIVLLVTSYENNCAYCMAAHSTVSKNMGLDEEKLNAIRGGLPILNDPRMEALKVFTIAMVRNRGQVGDKAIDDFLAAGFTRANIFEVITGVTMNALSNYVNQIANTKVDKAFEGMAWTKPELEKTG